MSSLPSTSSKTTRRTVKSLHNIDLIGKTCHQITGSKLPSNRQVLQTFFFNMRFVKLSAKESAKLVFSEIQIFWQKARIPTRYDTRCVEKLLKLYETWKNIGKTPDTKRSTAQKEKENLFVSTLDDLFDIAHADALKKIKIEEDKQFLLLQREKGRPGSMIGTDKKLYMKEKRSIERKEKELSRKRKYEEEIHDNSTLNASLRLSDSSCESENEAANVEIFEISEHESEVVEEEYESSDSETNDELKNEENVSNDVRTVESCKNRKHFITSRLVAALDNAKVSDGMAVHILIATAKALGHRCEDLVISRSSIRRQRLIDRKKISDNIQENFTDEVKLYKYILKL